MQHLRFIFQIDQMKDLFICGCQIIKTKIPHNHYEMNICIESVIQMQHPNAFGHTKSKSFSKLIKSRIQPLQNICGTCEIVNTRIPHTFTNLRKSRIKCSFQPRDLSSMNNEYFYFSFFLQQKPQYFVYFSKCILYYYDLETLWIVT